MVGFLLGAGAAVDSPDVHGHTPLFLAAAEGHGAAAKALLDAGASVDATDELGRTALHWVYASEHAKEQAPEVRACLPACHGLLPRVRRRLGQLQRWTPQRSASAGLQAWSQQNLL